MKMKLEVTIEHKEGYELIDVGDAIAVRKIGDHCSYAVLQYQMMFVELPDAEVKTTVKELKA